MFNFFDGIADTLSTIINYIVGFFKMLAGFFRIVGKAFTYTVEAIGFLPPFILVFVTVIVTLAILLQILNHGD